MKISLVPMMVLISSLLWLTACEDEITVQCHSDTTDLKFEDEYIGTIAAGETRTVPVKTMGSTLVTWTNYDNEAQSEEIYGRDVEEGKVWHLYHGYGSWDEW